MHHSSPVPPLTVLAWRLGGLTVDELWWRHLHLADVDRAELARYLAGATTWPDAAHDVLAQVLNEALWEIGCTSLATLLGDGEPAHEAASTDHRPPAAGTWP